MNMNLCTLKESPHSGDIFLHKRLFLSEQRIAGSEQEAANSRQRTECSEQRAAGSEQQAADSEQQTANSRHLVLVSEFPESRPRPGRLKDG